MSLKEKNQHTDARRKFNRSGERSTKKTLVYTFVSYLYFSETVPIFYKIASFSNETRIQGYCLVFFYPERRKKRKKENERKLLAQFKFVFLSFFFG